jgi:hypothetical protein
MTFRNRGRGVALASLCCVAIGCVAVQRQALTQETQADSAPVLLSLPAQPPKGAVTLFTGKAEQLGEHWFQRYGTEAPKWKTSAEGVLSPVRSDITTKQEFGDCYLHVEFRVPVDATGKAIGHGNSGVGLQGRYEVQIMDSYGQKPQKNGNGSLYNQIPPQVNVSKKPGEWQTFDIIFRAPRLDGNGQVTEKARATVFQNGVLVHNNAEFQGMTGIQYDQYKTVTKTGPLVLQGDHDPVQFRNLWIIPM